MDMFRTAIAVAIGVPLGLAIDKIIERFVVNPWLQTAIPGAALLILILWARSYAKVRTS